MFRKMMMIPGVALIAVMVCVFICTMCSIRILYGNINLNDTQTIRKGNGGVLGYIQRNGAKTTVRDANNRILGYSDNSGTYNAVNIKVADGYVPGYLMCSGGR